MKRVAGVVLCLLMLQGCGLPASVKVASWAIDGILFLTTEKSATDHGISLVAQKDCALWRGLKGEGICSEPADHDGTALASAEGEDATVATEELADFTTAAGPAPDQRGGGMFFVLGSFSQPENAEELARHHEGLEAGVITARLDDRTVFRVVVGPFEPGDQDRMMGTMVRAGVTGAWALSLDRIRPSDISRPYRHQAPDLREVELAERTAR